MCGIAGFFGVLNLSDETLNKCLDKMSNRGPDNLSIKHYTFRNKLNCYFLHSRLSIIDLEKRSNQPYEFDDCIIIADEMQNSTENQMKMLLTRIGENTKLMILYNCMYV